ncbi:MAG TPA: AAA family ATPase [Thermoanaerobaculia bacterium]|jgi:cytidylate kinase|nr:AAA family ATPase [Thermoanaerobaculia bacterium]
MSGLGVRYVFKGKPNRRRFLVISGLPASGKTTLGLRLADALGLPLLDKDEILEALFEGLGVGDAEWRNRLSRSADVVLQRLAAQTAGAVLASFWRHPQVTGESGTPTGWISALSGRVVEVHCVCPAEVAAERFLARKRHAGHLDRDKSSDDLVADFVRLADLGPLGLGPLVNVDTGHAVDFDGVLRQLEEHWG